MITDKLEKDVNTGGNHSKSLKSTVIIFAVIEALVLIPLLIYVILR